MYRISRTSLTFVLLILILSACAQADYVTRTASPGPVQATQFIPVASYTPPALPTIESTATFVIPPPRPTEEPTSTSTPSQVICSPLADIGIAELGSVDLLKNPFLAPRVGMDDGHHGVDFAYWSRGERNTMLGHPVLSVMDGIVAGVIRNRKPYGYAVMIETPLTSLPASWLEGLTIPEQIPTVQPASSLNCPPGEDFTFESSGERSLYLLYAHLNQLPEVEVDQPIRCGQVIGEVGTTGMSVNYHLHLETRVGPSEIRFKEMAHYESDPSDEESRAYCAWRVSGLFQMVDPMLLFQTPTLQP